MPARSATATRRRPAAGRPRADGAAARRRAAARAAAARRARVRRRAWGAAASGISLLVVLLAAGGVFHHAVKELALPLRHEDIIRQQAADKKLDPALIAGVIYTESHFRDGQTSGAGAEGLMQLTPATAEDIARKSGGTAFRVDDLGTPQVNISYGAFYLRYLLNRYGGSEPLALAAYNGGEGNVDRWLGRAGARGRAFHIADIPFPETRAYVGKVQAAASQYRREYRSELGL